MKFFLKLGAAGAVRPSFLLAVIPRGAQ